MPIGKWVVESCVLFCVASVLMALLFLPIFPGSTCGRESGSRAIVLMLDTACRLYHLEYGVFPPSAPDGNSQVLVE